MKKKKVHCAQTSAIDSPCIIGKTILFPIRMHENLLQEEFEAVVAHELSHLQWRDSLLRLASSSVAAFFWWIPTGWWQKRIEAMQEQGSDSMIHRFGISRFALAGAILKTAKAVPSKRLLSFAGGAFSLKRRMQMILQEPQRPTKWKPIQYGLLGLCLLSILFGKLWIF